MALVNFKRIPLIFVIDIDKSSGLISNWQDRISASGVDGQALQVVMMGLEKTGLFPALKGIESFKNKMVIPLLVNPQSFSITKNPKVTKTLTKKGLLTQTWQAEPDIVNIAGRAASQRSFFVLSQFDALSKTLENGSRNIVTMIYKFGGAYRGYIENFKTAVDAEQPGIFDYTFDFQFVDKNHFRLFLMSFKTSTLNQAINNPRQFYKETVKIAAKDMLGSNIISLGNIYKPKSGAL